MGALTAPMTIADDAVTYPDVEVLYQRPHGHADGHGQLRHQYRVGRDAVRGESGTAVESQPSEPQQREPEEHQRQVVRPVLDDAVAPLSYEKSKCQTCGRSACVDHRSAGKVAYREVFVEESPSPNPVGHWGVHRNGPYDQEQCDRLEAHPLRACAHDDTRRDQGERTLEHHELQLWYPRVHDVIV